MSLTDVKIRAAVAREAAYKLADGQGLFLFVTAKGAKSWRFKYRVAGGEKVLTFGLYPEVKLIEARERRDLARAALRAGRDPRAKAQPSEAPTFEMVARDWHKREATHWSRHHASDVIKSFEVQVFGEFGATAIDAIKVPEVLAALRKIEQRGAIETAHRVRQRVDSVFAFAIASGLTTSNPGAMVKGALSKKKMVSKQPALIELSTVRKMLKDALASNGQPVTHEALLLLALTAVRPGELRSACWDQFEEEAPEPLWTIPPENMKGDLARKAGKPHLVPLSPPAAQCIRRLRALTGSGKLVFPSVRHAHKPMSENTIGYLFNRAGYHGRQTAHGLRATFSSIMNEHFPADRAIIDLMLAHLPHGQSASEGAYNRAQHMTRRRELANAWAELLLGTNDQMLRQNSRKDC